MSARTGSVKTMPLSQAATLQTLDRGLLVLKALTREPAGMTPAEVAGHLGIHRPIAYRLLATLSVHGMVVRDEENRYHLGLELLRLARAVLPQLSVTALPVLRRLAAETSATAHLAAAEGDHAVAVAVVEPPNSDVHVAYRVGVRHPLNQGAPGIAILAGRVPSNDDPQGVCEARRRGYATSTGELQGGAIGIAVPLEVQGEPIDMSLGLVTMGRAIAELEGLSDRLRFAARSIAALIDPDACSTSICRSLAAST